MSINMTCATTLLKQTTLQRSQMICCVPCFQPPESADAYEDYYMGSAQETSLPTNMNGGQLREADEDIQIAKDTTENLMSSG